MRISDWSSDVCSSDLAVLVTAIRLFAWTLPLWAFIEVSTAALRARRAFGPEIRVRVVWEQIFRLIFAALLWAAGAGTLGLLIARSEEHTSELQSLMRTSYAVFCLKKKKIPYSTNNQRPTPHRHLHTPTHSKLNIYNLS